MNKENKPRQWNTFLKDVLWMLDFVWKKHFFVLFTLFIASTGIALVSLFQAFSNGFLINTIVSSISHGLDSKSVTISLVLVGLSLLIPGFLYITQNFFQKKTFFFLSKHFDLMIENKRINLDILQYENSEFNNLVNRANEKGVYVMSNLLTNLFYDYQSIITVIFSSIIIARQSIFIFIAIFAASIPDLIISAKYGRDSYYIWGNNINVEDRRKYWAMRSHTRDISGLTEIKLFGLGKNFIEKMRIFLEDVEQKQQINEKNNFKYRFLSIFLSQGVLLITIIFFTREAIYGNIPVGNIIFLFGGMVGFQNSVSALFNSIGKQKEDRMYLHDLIEFLKTEGEMIDGTEKIELSTSPEIRFENITFSYPKNKKKIYESLSLTISPGEKIAIVGLNGAGKTTLVKLLCRFYDPQKGNIFINGKDLKSIKRDSWYENMGVLFQDFAKFQFTNVGETISFGNVEEKYDEKKAIHAAHKADAKFIEHWQNKYEQQLGKEFKDGVEPSGGQWQKLALARMFYRDPKIWVLDEPTSAIDADAESKIFESLSKLPKDKTVILISHRFSTVRTADRIVVIDEGKIRENGTHEELMELNGEYARLFNLQAEGYK